MSNNNTYALLAIIILASLYLKLQWLTIGLVLLTVLLYGSESKPAKAEGAKAAPGSQGPTLRPVIYEDVGPVPSLYPEKQEIVIVTEPPKVAATMVLESLANITSSVFWLFKGLMRK